MVLALNYTGCCCQIVTWLFLKMPQFLQLIRFADLPEDPLYVPLHPYQVLEEKDAKCLESDMSPPEMVRQAADCLQSPKGLPGRLHFSFRHWTIMDYARAYVSGEITPTMVADRFLSFVHESSRYDLQMSFFINFDGDDIMRQAKESAARYKRGEPISVLDGVLIAVKDEMDCLPYPTTGGTTWLHKVRKCEQDAYCVSRLRACGAVLVGKTNMNELGGGVNGVNPHYGTARNPYNRSKITGGSSGGSAAVVAAGLCPVTLGVDGGGSVRIPAAVCGVIGLKPTCTRVSHKGVLPLNYTIGSVGIVAATAEDALITYAAISGGTPSDHSSIIAPKIGLPLLKSANYKSYHIKLAKFGKWFDDSCSDDIRRCCSNAVSELCDNYGWKIVEVTIPELEVMRLAQFITMACEFTNFMANHLEKYKADVGWDVRMNLSLLSCFNSHDYLNAQRVRNRQLQFHRKIFSVADVIVTPTISLTAYPIMDDSHKTGEIDYLNAAELTKYQLAGNFLGYPAVTVPVGYDRHGSPIGLQFIGQPWSESLLIHIASAMQAVCRDGQRKPEVFYDMLAKE